MIKQTEHPKLKANEANSQNFCWMGVLPSSSSSFDNLFHTEIIRMERWKKSSKSITQFKVEKSWRFNLYQLPTSIFHRHPFLSLPLSRSLCLQIGYYHPFISNQVSNFLLISLLVIVSSSLPGHGKAPLFPPPYPSCNSSVFYAFEHHTKKPTPSAST